MVNLSPTEESYSESYCSLKFAAQVNQCELGKPKRQIKDIPVNTKEVHLSESEAMDVDEDQGCSELPVIKAPLTSTRNHSTIAAGTATPSTVSKRPKTTPTSTNTIPRRK